MKSELYRLISHQAVYVAGMTRRRKIYSIWRQRLFAIGLFWDHRLLNRGLSLAFSWLCLWCQGVWLLLCLGMHPELTTNDSTLGSNFSLFLDSAGLRWGHHGPSEYKYNVFSASFVPLLPSLGVNLSIAGLDHSYEEGWLNSHEAK